MLLDLEDERLRARINRLPGDRVRLVLDYPAEDRYRRQVMSALADIIRSARQETHPAAATTEEAGDE